MRCVACFQVGDLFLTYDELVKKGHTLYVTNPAAARYYYDKASAMAPGEAEPYLAMGLCYLNEGRTNSALEALREAAMRGNRKAIAIWHFILAKSGNVAAKEKLRRIMAANGDKFLNWLNGSIDIERILGFTTDKAFISAGDGGLPSALAINDHSYASPLALLDEDSTDMISTDMMSCAQIIPFNPITLESKSLREFYCDQLIEYIKKTGWQRRKWVKSELRLYNDLLRSPLITPNIDNHYEGDYRWLMLIDIAAIVGYSSEMLLSEEMNKILQIMGSDLDTEQKDFSRLLIGGLAGKEYCFGKLAESIFYEDIADYLQYVRKNILFNKEKPYHILVTATMSAGKSTFINALVGKNITLSQNLACTSKIHDIIGKTFEDNYIYEDDYNLNLNAGAEDLMRDNKNNKTSHIGVSTYYDGILSSTRIIIHDSPGINSSVNQDHRVITEQMIRKRKYDLLIYVINATQIGINDDANYLDFIKEHLEDKKILFLVNKVDGFDPDEEDIGSQLEKIKSYLQKHGFDNPVLAPVSARAGVMAQMFGKQELGRSDKRQLYNFIDKFAELDLVTYYHENFPDIYVTDYEQEEMQLLNTCGLRYAEKIIEHFYLGVM